MIKLVDTITSDEIKGHIVTYRKATPKEKAADILADAIDNALGYWQESHQKEAGMTPREVELVHAQAEKLAQRIYKLLNV